MQRKMFWDKARHSPTALVVGGAGFVGTNLIANLLQSNPDIHIVSFDCYSSGSKENHICDDRVLYLRGHTARDPLEFPIEFPIVYHFGEYSRITYSFRDIQILQESNQTGTFKVLEYCRKHQSKLIYSASSSKLGNNGADENLSPYAWTKAKNVELINNYNEWYGLNYAIAYFFSIYGPGQINTGDYATVIGIFERQYAADEPLTVVLPGTQRRCFTHISDIIRGLHLIAEQGSGDGYLLGADENWSILEIAEMFKRPYVFLPERQGDRVQAQTYESRARTELGWQPEVRLKDYIDAITKAELIPP